MACTEIRNRLAALQRQERELVAVLANLQGAGLQVAQENLANIRADITATQAELSDCEAIDAVDPSGPRRPFTANVVELRCLVAGPEIGDQEPYLIVATVDVLAGAGFVPDLHTVLIGPWNGVRGGTTAPAPTGARSFWYLDGHAKTLASPRDAIFVVGLIENDGASPDAIRGSVQTSLRVSLASNLGRDHATLSETLRSAMAGAIDSFAGLGVGPGHLNFDDRIAVRTLDLTTTDLDAIEAFGSTRTTQRFTKNKRSGDTAYLYDITFELRA